MVKKENVTNEKIIFLGNAKKAEKLHCIENKIKLQIEEINKSENLILKFQLILTDQKNMLDTLKNELRTVLSDTEINDCNDDQVNLDENNILEDDVDEIIVIDSDDDTHDSETNTARKRNLKRKLPHKALQEKNQGRVASKSNSGSSEQPTTKSMLKKEFYSIHKKFSEKYPDNSELKSLLDKFIQDHFSGITQNLSLMKEEVSSIYRNVLEKYPSDLELIITLRKFIKDHFSEIGLRPSSVSSSGSSSSGNLSEEETGSSRGKSISMKGDMEQIKQKIKNSIIKSVVRQDWKIKYSNAHDCLSSLTRLEVLVKNYGKKRLNIYIQMGMVMQKLKTFHSKSYIEILQKRSIFYSISFINFLISLYKLSVKFPIIGETSLSLHFIKSNFRNIRILCEKKEI